LGDAHFFPVFLSVVCVVHNAAENLKAKLQKATELLSTSVSDYELIVVDNGSTDNGLTVLKELVGERGLPNLQVYVLTKEVENDLAMWAGLESSLGDFVAVIDLYVDDLNFLPQMLQAAVGGSDVVYAKNLNANANGIIYRTLFFIFNRFYRGLSGLSLDQEGYKFRVLSRRVINFILKHPQPILAYRFLPASAGFARIHLCYNYPVGPRSSKKVFGSIDRAINLLVSTTRAPMRLVTILSASAAGLNILYSIYVVGVALWKKDVAAGWVTLSLQQCGMFFLLSLVLLVLGEYILQMVKSTNEGPSYYVAQEFTSMKMMRHTRLNVDESPSRIGIPTERSDS